MSCRFCSDGMPDLFQDGFNGGELRRTVWPTWSTNANNGHVGVSDGIVCIHGCCQLAHCGIPPDKLVDVPFDNRRAARLDQADLDLGFFYADNLMTAIGQTGRANGTNMAQPEHAYFHVKSQSSEVESGKGSERGSSFWIPKLAHKLL